MFTAVASGHGHLVEVPMLRVVISFAIAWRREHNNDVLREAGFFAGDIKRLREGGALDP